MTEELTKTTKGLLIKLLKEKKFKIVFNEPLNLSNEKSPDLNLTIDEFFIVIKTNDENIQLQAAKAFSKMISEKENPPIDVMISKGIVPFCIKFLSSPQLQCEVCRILRKVVHENLEQIQYIINQGAVPLLIELLKCSSLGVIEDIVVILGYIGKSGFKASHVLLKEAFHLLIQLIKPETSMNFILNITLTLVHLSEINDATHLFKIIKNVLLNNLLTYHDEKILGLTCLIIARCTSRSNENIQAVIESGVVPKLIGWLDSSETLLLESALLIVCHIAGNNLQTGVLIAHNALKFLCNLLQHKNTTIVELADKSISNLITGNNVEQIQHIIDSDIITLVIQFMREGNRESQKVATRIVRCISHHGTVLQIAHLIQKKVLKPLCDLLMSEDCDCVSNVIISIHHILTTASKMGELNRVAVIITEIGGLDKLKALQKNKQIKIDKMLLTKTLRFFQSRKIRPPRNIED